MHRGVVGLRLGWDVFRSRIWIGGIAGFVLLAASAVGIAAQPRASATPVAATPAAAAGGNGFSVYFLRPFNSGANIPPFDVVAAAQRDDAPAPGEEAGAQAAAALSALVAGPNAIEREAGLTTKLPPDQAFTAVTVADGVATVTAPAAFFAGETDAELPLRLAQVVFTLTATPSIDEVLFLGEGGKLPAVSAGIDLTAALGRDDFAAQTPPILIESPAAGETVTNPVRVRGTANTVEGSFQLQVEQTVDGQVVILGETGAQTSGSGTRGAFDVVIELSAGATGPARLVSFQVARNIEGEPIDRAEVPIVLRP